MIRTERLLLRRWRHADREPFAAMNADPAVVEHLQGPMSRERSDDFQRRFYELFRGSHSFDDEQRIAITCFATAKVAS